MPPAMLKFAANISTLFYEVPILDRFMEAKRFGFSVFEAQNLYDINRTDLKAQKESSELELILMNSPAQIGSSDNPDVCGYACIPGKEKEFRESIEIAIKLAKALDCKIVHILAGLNPVANSALVKKTYIENLSLGATLLMVEGIDAVIEPICPKVKPLYYLNNFDFAVECLKSIKNEHLKLLLDIYHLEMIHRNTLDLLERFYPHVGHIQISQAPNREEPSFKGRIDYEKVFRYLERKRHSGYIGLEYTPSGTTGESLKFLEPTDTEYFKATL